MNPVKDLLDKKGIRYTESAKDYVTNCLNPDHTDKSPSFRIDKTTGITHCFSCGYSVNIFKHFGVLTNHSSIKVAKIKAKIKELLTSFNGVTFPEEMIPINRSFRGISVATLRKFGAFYTTSGKDELQDRIFFPIKDLTGKPVVYVGRHTLSDGNPKYLNYPTGAAMPIYPEVLEEPTDHIVLVEGLFDMLNLYDKGMKNVCCAFGVNTITKSVADKLLPLKVQGVTKVYVMFDGDDAGYKGASALLPALEAEGFIAERITLERDTDPGSMSAEDVEMVIEYMRGNSEISV